MAYSRMGELSDFYIYKSTLGGYDCYVAKSDNPDDEINYRNFNTATELLTFVELKISEGYKILPSSLERLKTESRG